MRSFTDASLTLSSTFQPTTLTRAAAGLISTAWAAMIATTNASQPATKTLLVLRWLIDDTPLHRLEL